MPQLSQRCPTCQRKLALSDMACRCGSRHCSQHRLPESHACSFDFKTHEKTLLEKTVVACVADKMETRV
jgi:predicted nucleic acid binding AN1-type Zn finger protein